MNEFIDRLRSHFGLTPAEARLALHLVAGETLRSAAVNLGISYETTRSSLKKIFAKTQTCRQAAPCRRRPYRSSRPYRFPDCREAAP
jgi:DNA-binding CsgD family transcriptional regulator